MQYFKTLVGALVATGSLMGASVAQAASQTGDVNVQTTLTSACQVVSSGLIDFGSVVALNVTGNKLASDTTGFTVACSSDLSPTIYSDTSRVMDDGAAHTLAFDLCLAECTGSNGLAAAAAGDVLDIVKDGTLKAVPLHARILATNFRGLPAGNYSKTVTISVEY